MYGHEQVMGAFKNLLRALEKASTTISLGLFQEGFYLDDSEGRKTWGDLRRVPYRGAELVACCAYTNGRFATTIVPGIYQRESEGQWEVLRLPKDLQEEAKPVLRENGYKDPFLFWEPFGPVERAYISLGLHSEDS